MVNTTITQNEVAEQIQARAQRGHELLLRKKQLIEHVSATTYQVLRYGAAGAPGW